MASSWWERTPVLILIGLKFETMLLSLSKELLQNHQEHKAETVKLLFPTSAPQVSCFFLDATDLIEEQEDTEEWKSKGHS